MAVVNLRNIPEAVRRRLRLRAASHGRSMESEALEILRQACRPQGLSPSSLQDWVSKLYHGRPPGSAVDELIAERRQEAKRE